MLKELSELEALVFEKLCQRMENCDFMAQNDAKQTKPTSLAVKMSPRSTSSKAMEIEEQLIIQDAPTNKNDVIQEKTDLLKSMLPRLKRTILYS